MAARVTLKPFVTDGCSGRMSWAWRRFLGRPPPWEGDCVEHDRDYWRGGSPADRRHSDLRLVASVMLRGYPFWAIAILVGVRVGGHPMWGVDGVSWGYGHPAGPAYRDVEPIEP